MQFIKNNWKPVLISVVTTIIVVVVVSRIVSYDRESGSLKVALLDD